MKQTKLTRNTISPKQQRSRDSKDTILEIATRMFAEKGLYGARIDTIADEAKVNKQRIYAYFGSKDDLYRQVLLTVYAKAAENKNIATLGPSDIPRMTEILLNTFFEFHRNNPLFWRLLVWENLNGGKSLSDADWRQIQSSYIDHIKTLYTTGQERGVFKKEIDFDTYLLLIFSASFFYYSNQITISHLLNLGKKDIRQDLIGQLNTLICAGVCNTAK